MGDKGQQQVRERVWIEKFDHTAAEPTLVETQFVETIRRTTASTGDDDEPQDAS